MLKENLKLISIISQAQSSTLFAYYRHGTRAWLDLVLTVAGGKSRNWFKQTGVCPYLCNNSANETGNLIIIRARLEMKKEIG